MPILVIIPTYQEATNIEKVLRMVKTALPDAGVLIVDDGSPDGTADLAEGLAGELSDVHVLRRKQKAGLGAAYRAGFAWGLEHNYKACVQMDADLSHDPQSLPGLVAPLEQGYDISIGSRYVKGGSTPNWPRRRLALSRVGNQYASRVLGLGIKDATGGFRAYSADLLRALNVDAMRAEGYGFQIEMTYYAKRHGASMIEVPIRFVDRVTGESKMSGAIVIEALGLVTIWGFQRIWRAIRH